jgi:hypothetical protein
MTKKNLLLVSFVNDKTLPGFLKYLNKKFNIKTRSVYAFKSVEDESKIFVTFRIFLEEGETFDLKKNFKNTLLIHKKGMTFYTINALNKLIEQEYGLESGNVNYKEYTIDWSKYENKFLLIQDNQLQIKSVIKFSLE